MDVLLVKITGEAIFDALDSLGKSSFILGSELWDKHFDSLLHAFRDYAWKIKLYGDDDSSDPSPSPPVLGGIEGQSLCST